MDAVARRWRDEKLSTRASWRRFKKRDALRHISTYLFVHNKHLTSSHSLRLSFLYCFSFCDQFNTNATLWLLTFPKDFNKRSYRCARVSRAEPFSVNGGGGEERRGGICFLSMFVCLFYFAQKRKNKATTSLNIYHLCKSRGMNEWMNEWLTELKLH